jgi:arylsulfatase A-like enzyme
MATNLWRFSLILIAGVLVSASASSSAGPPPGAVRPNFIIFLCDNLGYGDLGCFGSKVHRTPNVDALAAEGMRLTSFYAASGVCTPSRAALLTGCYPRRVGLHLTQPDGAVLRPVSPNGLHPDEVTIAEVLRGAGYATACIGKWHLGDQAEFLPRQQGFDEFFGIPYSDDMVENRERGWPPLPLMRGRQVVAAPADRNLLTRQYTDEAIKFITANRDHPFFLYLPQAMPGSTARPFASPAFQGRSANGPYGDSVEELDWSTGEILDLLRKLQLDQRTLLVWTSDNGAPPRRPVQGSNLPLRGWGYTTWEGGMRVPCLVRWPGHIPAGATCSEIATTMDLLPTFADLAGVAAPQDRIIDGRDVWPLLSGQDGAKSPHEAFYYYYMDQLQAVRSGRWKLHLPLEAKRTNLVNGTAPAEAELYDLDADLGETNDVAAAHPEVVERLTALAEAARTDLGDGARPGTNQRPAGRVARPVPQVSGD